MQCNGIRDGLTCGLNPDSAPLHPGYARYVHINPVKHGLVRYVADWPCSTFHRLVAEGVYPANWGGGDVGELRYND